MERVPNAVLLMRANEFVSNTMIDTAYERMKKLGFDMNRVSFRPAMMNWQPELLHIDVILDAYPAVGGGSIFDALYMGVPVITFYGERRNTRLSLSTFKQFGLEGLAVPIETPQEYIERAVGLVSDLEALDALHKNLRNMMKQPLSIRTRPYARMIEEKILKSLEEKFNA